jgi:hypothetical protein
MKTRRHDRKSRWRRRLAAAAIGLALTMLPVTFDQPSGQPHFQAALAKNDGGNGGGKGGGRGNDGGDRGSHGHGGGKAAERGSHGKGGSQGLGRDDRSLGEVVDSFRSGRAFGLERQDRRIERARDRYRGRLGQEQAVTWKAADAGRTAHRFTAAETEALIERGWGAKAPLAGYASHGERVRTMVTLAKALGYAPRVGALQANFGTPFENGLASLQAELEAAWAAVESDPAAAERVLTLEAELAVLIERAKPGRGPNEGWATVDLDVNGDGLVDPADLAALDRSIEDPPAGEGDGAIEETETALN